MFCLHGLEKAYERLDRKGSWDVLRIYGVDRQLREGRRAFHKDGSASLYRNRDLRDLVVGVGVK